MLKLGNKRHIQIKDSSIQLKMVKFLIGEFNLKASILSWKQSNLKVKNEVGKIGLEAITFKDH